MQESTVSTYTYTDMEALILSKFVEFEDKNNHKVLINTNRILDVWCSGTGDAFITLDGDDDYHWEIPDYEFVKRRIMEEIE